MKTPEYTFRACGCGNEADVIETALRVYNDAVKKGMDTEGVICPIWHHRVAAMLQIMWFNHQINFLAIDSENLTGIHCDDAWIEKANVALMGQVNSERHYLATMLGEKFVEKLEAASKGELEVTKTH
jgi:hypothetical protein